MFGIGSEELVVILFIFMLLFGGKKLPEISRSIGDSLKEIRKGLSDDEPSESKSKAVEPIVKKERDKVKPHFRYFKKG